MAATTISRATLTDSTSPTTGDIWNAALVGTAVYDKVDALLTASLRIERSSAGDIEFTVAGASNTAGSDAGLVVIVAGTSAGDPTARFTVTGGSSWTMGVDNSDSDRFRLARGSALGTSTENFLRMDQETVADTATSALSAGSELEGWLMVLMDEDNASGLFAIRGGSGAVSEGLDPQTVFGTSFGTASMLNVYWSTANSRYEVQNLRGGSRTLRYVMFGQG